MIEARALPAGSLASVARWQTTLVEAIKQLIARIRKESEIRCGINALMALDDRALADIGLSREEIAYAVRCGRFPTMVNEERSPVA